MADETPTSLRDEWAEMAARQTGSTGSTGSAGSAGVSGEPVPDLSTTLDEVREHLATYVCVTREEDLDLLTLWAAHTHVATECYTSPRLVIDSIMPESGKTTLMEHLQRLAFRPVLAASLSSTALLVRLLADAPRTILIDEADRSLDPGKEGIKEFIAVINSGYKRGATRPVLTPVKGGHWEAKEMPTFAPVAMAGNAPDLPDDTRSRCIRVLLMPDREGLVEPTDWEEIEQATVALGERLAAAMEGARLLVSDAKPLLPVRCVSRMREKWRPLARVALVAGGRWPAVVAQLIDDAIAEQDADREDGLTRIPLPVRLVRDIHEVWGTRSFIASQVLVDLLARHHPEAWGTSEQYPRGLTVQRLGRLLVNTAGVRTDRLPDKSASGYYRTAFAQVWRRLGIEIPPRADTTAETPAEPARPVEPVEPATQVDPDEVARLLADLEGRPREDGAR